MKGWVATLIPPVLFMFVLYKVIVYVGDSVMGGW